MRYLEKLNERQKRMEQKYFKKDAQSTTSEAQSHISATTATKQRLKIQRAEHQSANVTNQRARVNMIKTTNGSFK